jgi:hypothetical protein
MPRSAESRPRVRLVRRTGWHQPPAAGSAPTFATAPVYRPRRPAETPLYRVVQHHLNTFLARYEADEIGTVPRWTEREFRQYLTRGTLA